jgi:hypothetical protein
MNKCRNVLPADRRDDLLALHATTKIFAQLEWRLLMIEPLITRQGFVRNVSERRQDKAKIGEKAEFTGVNEYFEPIFNTVLPSAGSFRTKPGQTTHSGTRRTIDP